MPKWYESIDPNKHYLVMTNDFDSYYSCCRLQKITGVEIGGFYSFDSGLYLNEERSEGKEPIYVDLSISEGKAFDNHYTFVPNPQSINPNIIKQPYWRKYNGSTFALIVSLYGGIQDFSEEQIMALLALDGFYVGYYKDGGKYRSVNLYWIDMLGITEHAIPILEKYAISAFERFITVHKLTEQISIDKDGFLRCKGTMPKLPSHSFGLVKPIKKEFVSKAQAKLLFEKNGGDILVSNEIYKDSYVLNIERGCNVNDYKNSNEVQV